MAEQQYDWDDDFDPESFDRVGPDPGKYHMAIVGIDEDGGNRGEMIVDLEVLAGDTPKQEGRVHREYLSKTVKAMKRFHLLAIAIGFTTVEELKAMKERGERPSYDFSKAVGRQLCYELNEEGYNGQKRVKGGFNFFHLTHPKVEKWPKNAAMLQKAGVAVPPPEQHYQPPQGNTDNALDGVF
ncbi:hypothetical protein GYB59_00645 [bacterium]|nr:hypothetical protein [bacterium]